MRKLIFAFITIAAVMWFGLYFSYLLVDVLLRISDLGTTYTLYYNASCDVKNSSVPCINDRNVTHESFCDGIMHSFVLNTVSTTVEGAITCTWTAVSFFFITCTVPIIDRITQVNIVNKKLSLQVINLQRQLSERARVIVRRADNALPPYTEEADERGRLLTEDRLPRYDTVDNPAN
ncbi:hypothetical protein LOD99_14854 [Oopsacas minuta]|uniref:Uncharacterized protein n=1 Tax=Oopsacas minuta TaxID=111878 RepID=A0AAV7KE94_9METZ|nr:hypothetical protein LOD99_14854 [Oopsacas minuta]